MNIKPPLVCAIVAATAVAVGMAGGAAATMASPRTHLRPGSRLPAASRAVRVRGFRPTARSRLAHAQAPRMSPAASAQRSTNWSGYVAVAQKNVALRWVSASWNVPSISASGCAPGTSGYAYAVHWVGLDGYGTTPNGQSNTGEEIGVEGYCDTAGQLTYYAWYDMYPSAAQYYTGISPGDAISASVYHDFGNGVYTLILQDLTARSDLDVTSSCPTGSVCRSATAEVIAGTPGSGPPAYNLADFGMVSYTSAGVTSRDGTRGTLASSRVWTSQEVVMTNSSGNHLATPSPLYGGQAFNVTWDRSD